MSADVAAIVAGLTKVQREAVQDELFSLRTGVGRVRQQLIRKGLCLTSGMLNPVGEQVRSSLQQGEGRDG